MKSSRQLRLDEIAATLGHDFSGTLKIGGRYVPAVRDGSTIHVSGQVPRVGDKVLVTGRAGVDVTLADARRAASICLLRALTVLAQEAGSLERVRAILRINVYVQSGEHFTEQSEVADAASDILYAVFGEQGAHARTSVGVYQLPKNATVELDLTAAID